MKLFGLTIDQWELLLAKVPEDVKESLDGLGILRHCRHNKISIPVEKITHIICEDNRDKDIDTTCKLIAKYGAY